MAGAGDREPSGGILPLRFFEHLEELRTRLKVVMYAFIVAFAFFLFFSFQYVVVFGVPMWLPLPAVLPFTFSFLYGIAIAMGAQPLLQLQEFLDFILLFSLGFGVAFELPVVMYGLSALGIVGADFWKRHWRLATFAIFFFGA